tara:strand:+ start:1272 stop:2030 length:759 start_codon:yes stop_codon:yes gene_type:complete
MAIDMSKMRDKKVAFESRGGNRGNFWRPEEGSDTTIRILPTADGDPFKEFFFHYNVGKNPGFLSPKKNYGEDDPLDAFIRNLFNEGDEESIKMAKNLMARQRFFSPVIVRGQEDKGVQVWGYGKMVYQTLLNLVLNPDYGDITDPGAGTDLVIKYEKPAGASFPKTDITPRRRPSALTEDDIKVSEWLESIPEFDSLFERKTPAEVGQLLDEFLSTDQSAEASSTETTQYSNGPQASGGATSVDDAFNELLG